MNKEERRLEQFECGVQERLLSWVVRKDDTERVLLKRRSRIVLGKKIYKDFLKMYALACEGVKACLESVDTLKELRRLRYRVFVIDRILRRRKVIQAQKMLEKFSEGV